MLEDAAGIQCVVLACGYVDLRKEIDGFSMIIGDKYHRNFFEISLAKEQERGKSHYLAAV